MHVTSDENVLIELTPQEWAVACDALERVQGDYGRGYSRTMDQALSRVVRKLGEAREDLVRSNARRRELAERPCSGRRR